MQARSSGLDPLGSVIVPSSLEVALQTSTNQASGLMEHSQLLLGTKAQGLAYLVRRPAFDVSQENHLSQIVRHLHEGQAGLLQRVGAVEPNAEGLPGNGWRLPVTGPIRMIWREEAIGREGRFFLSRGRGNVPQQGQHE